MTQLDKFVFYFICHLHYSHIYPALEFLDEGKSSEDQNTKHVDCETRLMRSSKAWNLSLHLTRP